MFSVLRYCKCGLIAGLIAMLAGMAGQIYIYEVSDRNAALMQAAGVFSRQETGTPARSESDNSCVLPERQPVQTGGAEACKHGVQQSL